ncbi:MAG: DUF6279 family lipoprotein [Pseudomonadota bacterium]
MSIRPRSSRLWHRHSKNRPIHWVLTQLAKSATFVVIIALLSACGNNTVSVRVLYSRLDNTIADNFLAYATFSDEQKAQIERSARAFQIWHRKTQLPRYSDYMDRLADRLDQDTVLTEPEISRVFDTLEAFSDDSFAKSPMADSSDFLISLSDDQVKEINQHFARRNANTLERIRTAELEDSDRAARTAKFLRRADIELSTAQIDMLKEGFEAYSGRRENRVTAWQYWQAEFIALLRQRNREEFALWVENHLSEYRSQMEIRFPEDSRRNRHTTIQTALRIVNSMTTAQKQKIAANLRKTSSIFRKMATSKQTGVI